jgi:hypothetical protein
MRYSKFRDAVRGGQDDTPVYIPEVTDTKASLSGFAEIVADAGAGVDGNIG